MRALVTGVSGFAGSHLTEELLRRGYSVWGTVRSGDPTGKIEHLLDALHLEPLDLADIHGLADILSRAQPDVVFHIAALASVAASWRDVEQTFKVNVLGTVHLLDAFRGVLQPEASTEPTGSPGSPSGPRLVIVGSGEEYGPADPAEMPLTEESPLRPGNPYSASKAAQSFLCRIYARAYGLPVIYMRPFNHIGPRQDLGFVVSDFAAQIAEMEAGYRQPVIHVGNLEAQRDFCDVRDVVRAYVLVAERGVPGETYNVAAGKPTPIGRILELLLSMARVPVRIETDPGRLRPSDVPILVGSADKLRRDTGWSPSLPLETSLSDTLDYWRQLVRERGHS